MLNPEMSFIKDIIMNENLEDLRYLYFSGEYVTDNEVKTAKYLNSLPQGKNRLYSSYFLHRVSSKATKSTIWICQARKQSISDTRSALSVS